MPNGIPSIIPLGVEEVGGESSLGDGASVVLAASLILWSLVAFLAVNSTSHVLIVALSEVFHALRNGVYLTTRLWPWKGITTWDEILGYNNIWRGTPPFSRGHFARARGRNLLHYFVDTLTL